MDAIAQLQQLGFGEYEARAYTALLQRNPLTGYELAKVSGIPRANVYAVLDKLEERGAAVRVDWRADASGAHFARYAPVSPDEVLGRLGTRYQETLTAAGRILTELPRPGGEEPVWNIRLFAALLEHARAVVGAAHERLLVALCPPEAQALAGDLADAERRGIVITTFCLNGCPSPCGACRGQVFAYQVASVPQARWLAIVADGQEVLAGEISPGPSAAGIRSRQPLLVNLVTWYVRHTVALAAILGDPGRSPDHGFDPVTQFILSALRPAAGDTGCLAALVPDDEVQS